MDFAHLSLIDGVNCEKISELNQRLHLPCNLLFFKMYVCILVDHLTSYTLPVEVRTTFCFLNLLCVIDSRRCWKHSSFWPYMEMAAQYRWCQFVAAQPWCKFPSTTFQGRSVRLCAGDCGKHLTAACTRRLVLLQKSIWDDSSFVPWCVVLLLEEAVGRQAHYGDKVMDVVSNWYWGAPKCSKKWFPTLTPPAASWTVL